MNDKIIGIISYLPDDVDIREKRITKLKSLISFCKEKFKLPIIIIAQNWGNDIQLHGCDIYHYPMPLGIVEARKALRTTFLKEYNEQWLIMLDDDCKLIGNQQSVDQYLEQINSHPGMFGEFNTSLLKLFAIHRTLLEKVDFEPIKPENGEGFEDRIFVGKLRKNFSNKRFIFVHNGLEEYSTSTADPLSTWYKGQNLANMLENTQHYLDII